jgi:hypothetical protein
VSFGSASPVRLADVEFFELAGVTVDPSKCKFLAQLLGVTVVPIDVGRPLEEGVNPD